MPTETYDFNIRKVECPQCGAPVNVAIGGGNPTCTYCQTTLQVRPRVSERRQPVALTEPQRLAALKTQSDSFSPESSLSGKPTGLDHVESMTHDTATIPSAIQVYREEWLRVRRQASAAPNPTVGLQLFRLAITIASLHQRVGQNEQARAILETALDELHDRDQRDMIRLHLADAALVAGQPKAAQAWLRQVEPRPLRLELDTAYRLAQGQLLITQGRYEEVLTLVGLTGAEIPLLETNTVSARAACLRAHALMGLGRKDKLVRMTLGFGASATSELEMKLICRRFPGPVTSQVDRMLARFKAGMKTDLAVTMGGLISVIVLPIIVGMFSPVCTAIALPGNTSELDNVLSHLRSCPQTRAALGDHITWAFGSIRYQASPGHGSYIVGVKGDRARGRVSWYTTNSTIRGGVLYVDGGTVPLCN